MVHCKRCFYIMMCLMLPVTLSLVDNMQQSDTHIADRQTVRDAHLAEVVQEVSEEALEKPELQKFVVMTPPKSGTHLLLAAVMLMTKRPYPNYMHDPKHYHSADAFERACQRAWDNGKYSDTHFTDFAILQALRKNDWKILTIFRDPRAQILSRVFFSQKMWPKFEDAEFTKEKVIEILHDYIQEDIWPWDNKPLLLSDQVVDEREKYNICMVRFEDLVGPKGGGSRERQMKALRTIRDFISADVTEKELRKIAADLFNNQISRFTFRKGQIGEWREYFDDDLMQAYEERFGDYMHRLGYF